MSTHLPSGYLEYAKDVRASLWSQLRNVTFLSADIICASTVLLVDVAAISLSILIIICADKFAVGRAVHSLGANLSEDFDQAGLFRTMLIFAGVLCYFGGRGHFRDRLPFWIETRDIVLISTFAFICSIILTVLAHNGRLGLSISLSWTLYPMLAMVLRQIVKRLLRALRLWQIPVIIIGDKLGVADAVRLLNLETVQGYRVVGSLDPSLVVGSFFAERCVAALCELDARRLILSCDMGEELDDTIMQSIVRARIPFSVIPRPSALPIFGYLRIPFFSHDTVMVSYRDNLARPASRAVKLAFDAIASAVAIFAFSPIFLILSVLIRHDGGRAFFGHKRVGLKKRTFSCFKFRTMVSNSADVLNALLKHDPVAAAEWTATQKLANDPRITGVGKFLRATSLDELPQLLNVIRLEMSLVGPRPIVEQEVSRYADDIAYYYDIRPGLTGLWQVSGRSDTSYKQRVQLDSWYVRNWSLWHDTAILAKTIPAVLRQSGAC